MVPLNGAKGRIAYEPPSPKTCPNRSKLIILPKGKCCKVSSVEDVRSNAQLMSIFLGRVNFMEHRPTICPIPPLVCWANLHCSVVTVGTGPGSPFRRRPGQMDERSVYRAPYGILTARRIPCSGSSYMTCGICSSSMPSTLETHYRLIMTTEALLRGTPCECEEVEGSGGRGNAPRHLRLFL